MSASRKRMVRAVYARALDVQHAPYRARTWDVDAGAAETGQRAFEAMWDSVTEALASDRHERER